ncbi:acyl-CoA dehydrogenase family protein [Actinomadura sp. HBU206391]|uniref:acyl-CoA dehydrogenase family protein n=1 Tax=Actinomadura sp. HBU206391 TaxID=2731692 RepID=UPI00164F122D|nr:acyl-CoA dehydrogenase family protein [Actinomadura sp. HBU206391]MBC6462586.1 acyl-CoA dehydrogenase family protein [Actinomadura sp. HBU206391]
MTTSPVTGTALSAADRYGTTEAQRDLAARTRAIAEEHFAPRSLEWEETGAFPEPNLRLLADAGILGTAVPVEYGGSGGSWLDSAVVLEEIGRTCYVTAMATLGELGVQSRAIAAFGSDELKADLLPRIARGEVVCSICITEADSGSDVGSIVTRAVPVDGGYRITGGKALISRLDVVDIMLVCTRFGTGEGRGVSDVGFIVVERDRPGVEVSDGHQTLGGERLFALTLTDVFVPERNVLVGAGGFKKMINAFNGQRCMNASISIGIAQGALDAAKARATERRQFGKPIADFQGLRWMLADCAIEIEAARALVHRAAWNGGKQFPNRYDAAVAKVFANEMSLRVTDRVLQIFGGHGFLRDLPAERYLRWARYGGLGGGTPQLLRDGIATELYRERPATS